MNTRFGVFAKYWEPGAVKTRLGASIGDQAAARVYREFLRTLLHRFSSAGDRRELVFAPSSRRADFQTFAPGWPLADQGEGDLGQRMARFFQRAFDQQSSRVVLIGSDSPTLPHSILNDAFAKLREHPVVLGPSEDGGYYLVGARGDIPPIFDNIDWSTPDVWSQTIRRLERFGVEHARLSTWYDVDSRPDLYRLKDELEQLGRKDPVWTPLTTEIQLALNQPLP